METSLGSSFLDTFSALRDQRQAWKVFYPPPDLLLTGLSGLLADAEDFAEIRHWALLRLDAVLHSEGWRYRGAASRMSGEACSRSVRSDNSFDAPDGCREMTAGARQEQQRTDGPAHLDEEETANLTWAGFVDGTIRRPAGTAWPLPTLI